VVAPGRLERTRCCSRSNLAWWVLVGKGARVLENAWVDAESVSHTWELLLHCPSWTHLSLSMQSAVAGYQCFEGDCASQLNPRLYRNQQSLRQHQYKKHADTKEEDTSLGRALTLKRAHDADVEEMRKRQLLEAEMAHRTPEPEPPHPV